MTYAIQRPDGSIVVDTLQKTEDAVWEWFCYNTTHMKKHFEARGYKCVRVTVTVEPD